MDRIETIEQGIAELKTQIFSLQKGQHDLQLQQQALLDQLIKLYLDIKILRKRVESFFDFMLMVREMMIIARES